MKSAQPSPEIISAAAVLSQGLGYHFSNLKLLSEALTHRSFALGHEGRDQQGPWNERLEFLGDAVLSLILSEYLHALPQDYSEGELSKIRAALVNEGQLAAVARSLSLGSIVITSQSERRTGGGDKNSLLADALEAVFGAIFLDGGFDAAKRAILKVFSPLLQQPLSTYLETDYKTMLQEWTQDHFKDKPSYHVIATHGPAHTPCFDVAVIFRDEQLAVGQGQSKKAASQHAAQIALDRLRRDATLNDAHHNEKERPC